MKEVKKKKKKRQRASVCIFNSGVYTISTPTAGNQLSERHVNVLLRLCVEKGQQGKRGTQG